jgi:hypothetical protein
MAAPEFDIFPTNILTLEIHVKVLSEKELDDQVMFRNAEALRSICDVFAQEGVVLPIKFRQSGAAKLIYCGPCVGHHQANMMSVSIAEEIRKKEVGA